MTPRHLVSRALAPRLAAVCGMLFVMHAASACSRDANDDDDAKGTPVTLHRRSASAAPEALGEGDVRIVSGDSGVDLALIGDSISAGLSAATLAKVRRETDTSTVKGNDFGASIERMVKGTVASAIGTRVVFPLSAVRDVRYEQGELKFDWVGRPVHVFASTKTNGRPTMQSFAPADAQRFVAAVRARKQREGAPR